MLFVLGVYETICIVGTMAAGPLVRRHGRAGAVVLPYLEIVIPCTYLVLLVWRLLLGPWGPAINIVGGWQLIVIIFLVLAIMVLAIVAALRRWPWFVRLLLQAGWLSILIMATVHYWR
jgi:hypothetical protein